MINNMMIIQLELRLGDSLGMGLFPNLWSVNNDKPQNPSTYSYGYNFCLS